MRNKILIALGLISFGVLSRTILHTIPNLEFITAISILSGYIFVNNKKYAMIVPFSIMLISDLIIGNQLIYIFTWSGFLVMTFAGMLLIKFELKFGKDSLIHKLLLTQGAAVFGTLFFYFWTNFGVVLVTNMYDKSIGGLIQSYIMGLPFLKIQLAGNILFVPLFIFGYNILRQVRYSRLSKEIAVGEI